MNKPAQTNSSWLRSHQTIVVIFFVVIFAIIGSILLSHSFASNNVTLFSSSSVPKTADSNDPQAVEVGVKFKSDVAGTVTGIRFYKSAKNTGTHVGSLWDKNGTLLASVTFQGESNSGWQQAQFSSAVAIQPNTTYVISYHTNSGHYSDDTNGFANLTTASPLHIVADGTDGPNGVYSYGANSSFPKNGWQASNYWVDAIFNPTTPSTTPTPPTPTPQVTGGSIQVDQQVATHQSKASTTITSPGITTHQSNELLLAFISSDGSNTSGATSFSSVSGGGLTWTLRQRANSQPGDAEIWQAVTSGPLSNVAITATRAKGSYVGSLVVSAFMGADTASQKGATASAGESSSAPSVTLTTTADNSWSWAVANDYNQAKARTLGTGQSLADQYLAPVGDTYWTQYLTAVTAKAGTGVTLSSTAPTSRGNIAAIEIVPAASTGSTPPTLQPSAPVNLTATAQDESHIALAWNAGSGGDATTSYAIYRNGTKVGTSTAATYTDSGLTASTTYSYTVVAMDAAGAVSASSNTAAATTATPAQPPTPPTVPSGLTSSHVTTASVTLTWAASDGATSYLVLRDNAVIGTSTTTSYTDTTVVANQTYSYQIEAQNAQGAISAPTSALSVTTPNPADTTPPSTPAGLTAVATSSNQVNLGWSASTDNVGVASYTIYRNGTKVGTSTTTSFGDATVSASTAYSYSISATDGAGNESKQSAAFSVTTPSSTPTDTGTAVTPALTGYLGSMSSLKEYAQGVATPDGCSWLANGQLDCGQDNLTLDHVYIPKGGLYWTGTGSLTITDSIILSATQWNIYAAAVTPASSATITVKNSTVGWASGSMPTSGWDIGPIWTRGDQPMDIEFCDISNAPQGIDPTGNSRLASNYIHNLTQNSPASTPSHIDGIYSQGGDNIEIDNNYDDVPVRSDVTAAMFIQNRGGTDQNVAMKGNYFNGGAYVVRNQSAVNATMINNVLGNSLYGYVGDLTGYAGTYGTWSGNTNLSGTAIPKP